MNPNFVELSLSLKPSYVPKSLSNLLFDLSKIDNESDKLLLLSDYICKHQEELSRVEASKHELPQCRLLLMEAIEALKKEFMNIKNNMESHQSDHHHLVEYLGTKRKNNEQQEQREIWGITYDDHQEDQYYCNPSYVNKQKTLVLDNNNFQPPNLKAIHQPLSYKEISTSNSTGSSSTAGKEKVQDIAMYDQCSSINSQGFFYLKTDDDDNDIQSLNHHHHHPRLTQPIWKNNKRCWSSELHARFVEALNMLGGIEVATPMQIRDLMQVEGLTIDQVKSHLQKYRLHCGKVLESYVN